MNLILVQVGLDQPHLVPLNKEHLAQQISGSPIQWILIKIVLYLWQAQEWLIAKLSTVCICLVAKIKMLKLSMIFGDFHLDWNNGNRLSHREKFLCLGPVIHWFVLTRLLLCLVVWWKLPRSAMIPSSTILDKIAGQLWIWFLSLAILFILLVSQVKKQLLICSVVKLLLVKV